MMKILMLTGTYPEPDDGKIKATFTVQYFCEQWVKQNNDVIVIHNSSKFPLIYYFFGFLFGKLLNFKLGFNIPKIKSRRKIEREENGVKIYRLPLFKIVPHTRFNHLQITKQVNKINKILSKKKFKPDIIMSHWLNPQLDLLAQLKKIYNVRTSLVFHETITNEIIKKFDLVNLIQNVDAIGCRSFFESKKTFKTLSLAKEPFVCCSGIPNETMLRYSDIENKPFNNNFLYVGRLIERKNIDISIKALCKSYPNKNFNFTIVGDGPQKEQLRKLSIELQCEDNIRFLGNISREKVFEQMQKSDCFIMASSNEIYGMVYIESMLTGCITIATINGGCDGIIVDGVNGLLVHDKSINSLVDAINKIKNMRENEMLEIRLNAHKTAMNMTDSNVAGNYLYDALNW